MRPWATGTQGSGVRGRSFPRPRGGPVSRVRKEHAQRQQGLDDLCARYWKPIYGYVRRAWRKSNEDAKDLTQAFFLWLVDGEVLKKYDPGQGSFRFYLKGLLCGYVSNHKQAVRRLKRGGNVPRVTLDEELGLPDSKAPGVLALDDALEGLGALAPRQSRIVELKIFGGLTLEEIAGALSISRSTVRRECNAALLWLRRELSQH